MFQYDVKEKSLILVMLRMKPEELPPLEPLIFNAASTENIEHKMNSIELNGATAENGTNADTEVEEEPCKLCEDEQTCFHCGCRYCGLKQDVELLLFCEECHGYSHTYCNKLEGIPEDDWFVNLSYINPHRML